MVLVGSLSGGSDFEHSFCAFIKTGRVGTGRLAAVNMEGNQFISSVICLIFRFCDGSRGIKLRI
jgi:hypothetical protein